MFVKFYKELVFIRKCVAVSNIYKKFKFVYSIRNYLNGIFVIYQNPILR